MDWIDPIWRFIADTAANTLDLSLLAAPWFVAGLVAAGVLKAFMPESGMARMLGRRGTGSAVKAAIIGAPLPLCSCGVLPAAFGLRRGGASKGATASFLVATPETGVDSIALSYVLLGPIMAVVRPIAAIASAITAGVIVDRIDRAEQSSAPSPADAPSDSPCCASSSAASTASAGETKAAEPVPGRTKRLGDGLGYAFTRLLDDLSGWLVAGMIVAGLLLTIFPPASISAWASGPLAMLAVLAISVPMYVCASASTPVAHAMILAGVSPGTALVFLLAGPASNFAGIMLIRRELGTRAVIGYLIGVIGGALAFGLALDWAVQAFGWQFGADLTAHGHSEIVPNWLAWGSLTLLLAAMVRPLRRGIFTLFQQTRAQVTKQSAH